MKRKVLVILALILFVAGLSACDDKVESKEDSHSLVNFTDTGENSSNISSHTKEIEHSDSSSDTENVVTSNESNVTASENNNSKESRKSSSDNKINSKNAGTTSSETSAVNTITYYYYSNDGGGNNNNDNSSFDDDSDDVSSQISSVAEGSDTDLLSESDTDTEIDTDSDVNSNEPDSDEPIYHGSYTSEDIALFINGEKIRLGDEIESVVEIIGKPKSVDVISGSDNSEISKKMYNYDDFWITVANSEEDSEYRVEAAQIFNDTLETEKGVRIGMTLTDVLKAYGESSTVSNDEHRYYVGKEYMYFDVQNGIVADIGYRIDNDVDNEKE